MKAIANRGKAVVAALHYTVGFRPIRIYQVGEFFDHGYDPDYLSQPRVRVKHLRAMRPTSKYLGNGKLR